MEITNNQLKELTLSTSQIATITGVHRHTATKKLDEAEISPDVIREKEKRYKIAPAVKAITNQSQTQTSADRRNEAQARKLEIESENLLKKNIPISEIMRPLTEILTSLNRVVQDSKLDNDEKEQFIDSVHDSFPEVEI